MDVAGERSDDDPPLGTREDLLQDRRDLALARDETRHLRVGRVTEQEVDALLAETRERP